MGFRLTGQGVDLNFPNPLHGDSLDLEFLQTLTHTHFNGGLVARYSLPWRPSFKGQWHRLLELVGSRVRITIDEPQLFERKWRDIRRHDWHVYITDESRLTDQAFELVCMIDDYDQRASEVFTRSGQG